ncbi:MAG: hypothetical protein ACREFO_10295, partial [Acetobacteraceae bacterium]
PGAAVARSGAGGSALAYARGVAAARGRASRTVVIAVTGAMRASGAVVARVAWRAAGAIEATAAAAGYSRAALLGGTLAGWLRALAAAFGRASGGQAPLVFDSDFWMVPPVTGLTMTSYSHKHNAGPYQ